MRKRSKAANREPPGDAAKGLFRTTFAGPGRTLAEAFANLERADRVREVIRHPARDLFGGRVEISAEEGRGHWDFTRVRDDFFVMAGDFAYKDPRVELLTGDDLVQLYFKLSGDITMAVSRNEPLEMTRPALLLYRQPRGTEVREWLAPNSHERFVTLDISPRFLETLCGAEHESMPEVLARILQGGSSLHCSQVALTSEMFELASRIVDNPHAGALRLVYTEAVAMQLLCVTLAALRALPDSPTEHYTAREVAALHTARQLLMNRLSEPPTIRQLARTAGLNETTLKRGFKAMFGETIFDFSVRCRMQRALTLLREQRVPVAEVGEAVGYRHQTSFATAFRRHFGMRPKDVKRTRQA